MKKIFTTASILALVLAFCAISQIAKAQSYGIVFGDLEVTEANAGDIFGDGMAAYDPELNLLMLRNGFDYHLSHGKVTINTGNDFTIMLLGRAEIYACIESEDPVVLASDNGDTLKITSNISGSALKCKSLFVPKDFCLDLLSRNSQDDMYALDCEKDFIVDGGYLFAEVTTADMAVKTTDMTLTGSYLLKPRGGNVNPAWGGICFADGTRAKTVWIVPDDYNVVDEHDVIQGESSVQKVFENGRIVIIRDGKRYNVLGQRER